jgi:hypothetical protein
MYQILLEKRFGYIAKYGTRWLLTIGLLILLMLVMLIVIYFKL